MREPPAGPVRDRTRSACGWLAGDRVDYDFSATLPVAFNIHYHEGNAVVAPVVREGARTDSGVFAPRLAQDYCLMWEAGPGGALLDYRLRLRVAARLSRRAAGLQRSWWRVGPPVLDVGLDQAVGDARGDVRRGLQRPAFLEAAEQRDVRETPPDRGCA